jgi:microcystin-dependent protein
VPLIGEIRLFPWGTVPPGWAQCDGRLLQTRQETALFQLLGTTYGGDGVNDFAVPDLRGRVPVGAGPQPIGKHGGEEAHALTEAELPAHTHVARASADAGGSTAAGGNVLAGAPIWTTSGSATTLADGTVTSTGGNRPHPNMQPYLALAACIAVRGSYPTTGP